MADNDGEVESSGAGAASDPRFISRLGLELLPHLVRLLAEGRPVEPRHVAETAGLPPGQVEGFLRAQPGTDWDDDGRVAGFGLTLRPTPHRFVVEDRVLYTWCATDTLVFPAILGRRATVESACPATARPIRLEVAPDGVLSVDPPTAVVSQVHPAEALDDIRRVACRHGHFFASPDAARHWATEHPTGRCSLLARPFECVRAACKSCGWIGSSPLVEGPEGRLGITEEDRAQPVRRRGA